MTDNGAKVHYVRRNGGISTAYLDDVDTGVGTDKHSDIPIIVQWSDELEKWIQVDPWEWKYVPHVGFVREDDPTVVVPA